MEITRMMTIAENDKVNIKQADCGKVYLNYDNARIYFNKGSFLKFLIEIDDWCIKNEKESDLDLIVKACCFSIKVKREDINNFVEAVHNAAYNIVPILNIYKEMNSNKEFFKYRIN